MGSAVLAIAACRIASPAGAGPAMVAKCVPEPVPLGVRLREIGRRWRMAHGAWRMALGARTWRCKPLSAWAARWQVLPRCNGLATSPAACRSVRRQLRHRAAGIGAGLRRHRQPAVRPAGGALLPRRPRRLPLHAAAPFPRPASAVRVPASQPHRWRVHTATFLELLVKRLCEVWPEVRIILRG